jgi:hypothetical protein
VSAISREFLLVGLRTKFNLMLLLVALAGVAAFALASTPVLDGLAKDEVLQTSRIMMASAAGARKYTSDEIAPLLMTDMAAKFHPQAVSAYAAKKTFAVLRARSQDYSYREAALNPTNPEDQASDWEADIINDFRDHPGKSEVVLQRQTANGPALILARPLLNAASCLECHSTPGAAPPSMLAVYGPYHGFGWKPGDIIGAQLVSVPMTVADRMAKIAEAVSMGDLAAPEYSRPGKDQIARLSGSINRLRRSLHEALRMLSDA